MQIYLNLKARMVKVQTGYRWNDVGNEIENTKMSSANTQTWIKDEKNKFNRLGKSFIKPAGIVCRGRELSILLESVCNDMNRVKINGTQITEIHLWGNKKKNTLWHKDGNSLKRK